MPGAETTRLEICTTPWPEKPERAFLDFKVGRIVLSRHFGIRRIGVLSIDKVFCRQLLLRQASAFSSGRVEKVEGGITWRDFGWEWTDGGGISQPGYLAGAGPYVFDADAYRAALYPYVH